MTTQPCNLGSMMPVSEPSDLPTNSGSTSPKPLTNTPKPQTNAIDASANAPMTSSVLAERYEVGDRSIQLWIKRLIEECGVLESRLKENSGNQTTYSTYCVELLDSLHTHRTEGKKRGLWFNVTDIRKKKRV